ncbi:helix-hairpin-helix domain-containing protein [Actinomycetospora flava]|uniref:Helix-hairpin-helix domain-containing protein n=1 Tax=Actinomycetospora flava TaxID=3129232 RepID=A0ABU8M2C0_9PSEU
MPRAAAPDTDDARARLRSLGSGWGGRDAVEVGAPPLSSSRGPEPDGARVGWPGAAPGTPAARLRLPPREPPDEPAPARAARDTRDDWWDDDEDDEPVRSARRGSAWDPPERGERARRWAARWLPASWSGARWDPGRTGALALAAVAAVAAVVAAVGVWSDRPVAEPVPALPVVAGAPVAGSPVAAPPPDAGPIVVSVSGKVARPGLVRLPPGSRVGEAIDAAGGASPEADLTGLNLAARLTDGEQVVVGVPAAVTPPAGSAGAAGAAPAGGGGGGGGGAGGGPAPGGPVNLNTATLEQLDQLPGVGPVTAQRILEWRTQNGRFGAVEQLQEVNGIGDARFATLRDLVTV